MNGASLQPDVVGVAAVACHHHREIVRSCCHRPLCSFLWQGQTLRSFLPYDMQQEDASMAKSILKHDRRLSVYDVPFSRDQVQYVVSPLLPSIQEYACSVPGFVCSEGKHVVFPLCCGASWQLELPDELVINTRYLVVFR